MPFLRRDRAGGTPWPFFRSHPEPNGSLQVSIEIPKTAKPQRKSKFTRQSIPRTPL
jgi:hypothetical protein